jgi:hypothetical protein
VKIETNADIFRIIGYYAEVDKKRCLVVLAKMPAVAAEMSKNKILSPPLRSLLKTCFILQTISTKILDYSIGSPSNYLRRKSAGMYATKFFNRQPLSR